MKLINGGRGRPLRHQRSAAQARASSDTARRARQTFIDAQQRMLERYGVEAQSRFVEIPSIEGVGHLLVCGKGPAVVMINGIGIPGAMWAPLMAELEGFRLFVVDLPGYGLTDTTLRFGDNLRLNAVTFLNEVLDGLRLDHPAFVGNSLGSLWASWLALEQPNRVSALVHVGCPAVILDTSVPIHMRFLSVPVIGRLLTWLQPPSPKQVDKLSKMVNEFPLVPELVDLLVATEKLPGFRPTLLYTLHALLRLRGSRPNTRLTANQLAKINQPTLLFWSKNDPFGPSRVGEDITSIMPNAEIRVVGGGHTPWLTEAERIGPVAARFISQHQKRLNEV